jgi:hypothetical protein
MKRLNKEYKLDVCNYISLKYGTVNKDNPQVIYVSGKCWICPKKEMNYEPRINNIEKEMKKRIKTFLTDGVNFDNKFILDFDVNLDGISPEKKKFLSFDFYLRQNEKNNKKLKDLKEFLERKVSTISNNLVYLFRDNDFEIEKKK